MTTFLDNRTVANPVFYLKSVDDEFDYSQDVAKLVYSSTADGKAASFDITLNNRAYKYSDDPKFVTRTKFKIRWGYLGKFSPVHFVVLASAPQSFEAEAGPVLIVKAWDLSIALSYGGQARNWGPVSSSAVAEKIAKAYNLRTVIEDSGDARDANRVQTAAQSDIQYLKQLAAPLDWECYITGVTLHFHSRQYTEIPTNTYDFFMGRNPNVLKFVPSVKQNQPKTAAAGASAKEGAPVNSTPQEVAKLGDFWINTTTKTGVLIGGSAQRKLNPLAVPTSETNPAVVKKQAAATQSKIDMSAAEATAELIGDPTVTSKKLLVFRGVGQYSGPWYVKEDRHEISSAGYKTSVKLVKDALGKGEKGKKDKNKPKKKRVYVMDDGAMFSEDGTLLRDPLQQWGTRTPVLQNAAGTFDYSK
jgi:phage protein D